MEDKITIIEGPSPTFEIVDDGWSNGVLEGPSLYKLAVTHLRTFNGSELLERCHRAWRHQENIQLEYRAENGESKEATIAAARTGEMDDGEVLILWIRLPDDDIELAFDLDDDFEDDGDDFSPPA